MARKRKIVKIRIKGSVGATVNREMKDTLFRFLFSTETGGREIYSAFSNSPLPDKVPVEVITLNSSLFTNRRNDVAYIIGNLVLMFVECQSTPNPNMPIRLFLYSAPIYERIITALKLQILSETRQLFPRPKFAVLYNGKKNQPAVEDLKLSDSFLPDEGLDIEAFTGMEIVVRMYNIHHPDNAKIVEKSKLIFGFKFLTDTFYDYKEQGLSNEDAMRSTVNDCKKNDVLVDTIATQEGEVFGMLCAQYDHDEYFESVAQVAREEEREKADARLKETLKETRKEDREEFLEFLKKEKDEGRVQQSVLEHFMEIMNPTQLVT
jgi:hypothetical protein